MSTFTLMGVPGLVRKVLNYLEANGNQINNLADLDAPVSECAKEAHYTSARAGYLDNLQAYTTGRGAKLDNLDNLDAPVSAIATGAVKQVTRYASTTNSSGYLDVTVPAGTDLSKSVLSFLSLYRTSGDSVIRTSMYLEELNSTTIRVHGTNYDGTSTSGNITVRWQLVEYY